MSARLFQGARVSIGGAQVKDSLAAYTVAEVAAIVGRHMFENAVAVQGEESRVYPGGLPTVFEECWPYQARPVKQDRLRIGRILRSQGFIALSGGMGPGGFNGYRVPKEYPSQWPTELPRLKKTVNEGKQPPAPDAPVRTAWQCRKGCGKMFEQVVARDVHEKEHEEKEPEQVIKAETPKRKRKHRQSVEVAERQFAIQELVEGEPGLLNAEIQARLGLNKNTIYTPMKNLIAEGLIVRSGKTGATRYWPASPKGETVTEKKEYTPAPKPEKVAPFLPSASSTEPSANGLPLEGSMLLVDGKLYRVKLEAVN